MQTCSNLFEKWKVDAYDKVVAAHDHLKNIQGEIEELKQVKAERNEQLDKMHLVVFEIEQRWNFLMKLQV